MPGSFIDQRERSNEELKSKGRIKREMQWGSKAKGSRVLQNISKGKESLQKRCAISLISSIHRWQGQMISPWAEQRHFSLQVSRGAGSSWQATKYDYNNKSKSNNFPLEIKIGFLPATVWHDHRSTANRIWKSKNLKLLQCWAKLCLTLHLTLGSSLPIKFLSGTFPYASGPLRMVNALKGCKFPGEAVVLPGVCVCGCVCVCVCVCVCLRTAEGGGLAWHLRKRRSNWFLREAEEELEGESIFGDLLLPIAVLCDLRSNSLLCNMEDRMSFKPCPCSGIWWL